jgi:hypothetical protein
MNTELQSLLEKLQRSTYPPVRQMHDTLAKYLETRDPADAALPPFSGATWEISPLASHVAVRFHDDPDANALAAVAILNLGKGPGEHPFVHEFVRRAFYGAEGRGRCLAEVRRLASVLPVPEPDLAAGLALWATTQCQFGWIKKLPSDGAPADEEDDLRQMVPAGLDFKDPLECYFAALDDENLGRILAMERSGTNGAVQAPERMVAAFAIHRPSVMGPWMERALAGKLADAAHVWSLIARGTDRWDQEMMKSAALMPVFQRLRFYLHLVELGREVPPQWIREAAVDPKQDWLEESLGFLAKAFPEEFLPHFIGLYRAGRLHGGYSSRVSAPFFELAAAEWGSGGKDLFDALLELKPGQLNNSYRSYELAGKVLEQAAIGLARKAEDAGRDAVRGWFLRALEYLSAESAASTEKSAARVAIWQAAADHAPEVFLDDLKTLLGDKSKSLRSIAVKSILARKDPQEVAGLVERNLTGKVDERLGAAELLEQRADPADAPRLAKALETEESDKVRQALRDALRACGAVDEPVSAGQVEMPDLSAFLAKHGKGLKPVSCPWLELGNLPALVGKDNEPLPESAVTLLITKQSKHKTLDAAPDMQPLLAHIDREKSAPFAAALVEGFLNSVQSASDRWALTLGGLLGDNRIITLLLPRINDWCENSRHKLAEYAAQAISLLPGNEPLMVLDTLSNRYRSKFKNVGKACADAFNAAATARGITADELGDLVVPDFGFDAEGIRRFEWPGGGVSAELGADFKLTWFDAETEKSWKSLPATAPEEIKTEVKTLTKLLREAVKGQTARLEMTLVRQRRWPVARWRELYENHPLLRSFASSLVWGTYDAAGNLLRTFRRYPNGLLADAAGALEELPESDTVIGMAHPLEMDAAALDAWRAHLARFKVKQPFPQIERPVELMDPLHGNRRSIATTQGKKLSAGTFKSRAEKRGWTRGSVIDAGGISSYYKLYPGAGVEVVLPTNNFYVGIDPMEEIELEPAYFATAGSVERGSYIYDEPAPDDPRVLRFDQVSAVVFSETLADLKAITATKE